MRYAPRSETRALSPPKHNIEQILASWLPVVASLTNPPRPNRSNPRHAKRSHRYETKPADPARRPKPRGPFTLVMLPLAPKGGP